jgi:hypothetical protein
VRKPGSWLRHLVHAWLPVGGRRNRFGRAALAPAGDKYIEPGITGLLSELIAGGNQLRRQVNVGKTPDEQTWKAETIDWLRRAESLSKNQRPSTSVKVVSDLNAGIDLYRMLISHQLSDLKHIKESQAHQRKTAARDTKLSPRIGRQVDVRPVR